jgi:hypothetical protein
MILTLNQYNSIGNLALKNNQAWMQYSPQTAADGQLWKDIAILMGDKFKYYDIYSNSWTSTMPNQQEYVQYYPFPLPFYLSFFNEEGFAKINEKVFDMPWSYQLFNNAFMMRSMCIDAVFLNEFAISKDTIEKEKGNINYVDLLKANASAPLSELRSWEEAIKIIMDLISQPIAHPFLSKFSRIPSQTADGPLLVLLDNTSSKDIATIQKGALDKKKYPQSGKPYLLPQGELPQAFYANLEIDHWMSEIANALGYETVQRIQHWCGNKSIAFDIELINLKMAIRGNLIDNTLADNIYDIWNRAFEEGTFVLGNPEVDNVYSPGLREKEPAPARWARPPWIGYDPQSNLYGWLPEDYVNFSLTGRLSYCPVSSDSIGLSNSYPEYNKYIWNALKRIYVN